MRRCFNAIRCATGCQNGSNTQQATKRTNRNANEQTD